MATSQEVLAHLTGHVRGAPTRISWRDFTEIPRSPAPPKVAHTSADFLHFYGIPNLPGPDGSYRLANVQVTVKMNRGRSWVVKGAQSAGLLNHEQGHYTIVWTVARDLCRRLLEMEWDAGLVQSLLKNAKVHDAVAFMRLQVSNAAREAQKYADDLNDLYDNPPGGAKNAAGAIVPSAQLSWDQMLAYSVANDTAIPLLNSMLTSISSNPAQWSNLPKPPATTP